MSSSPLADLYIFGGLLLDIDRLTSHYDTTELWSWRCRWLGICFDGRDIVRPSLAALAILRVDVLAYQSQLTQEVKVKLGYVK